MLHYFKFDIDYVYEDDSSPMRAPLTIDCSLCIREQPIVTLSRPP